MAKGRSYLFLGPEIGEKLEAVKELRAALGENSEDYSFYFGETPLNQILSILLNGSLFAGARLIQIKNAEGIKKKEDIEAFVAYMEAPRDDTVLVLVSDQTSVDKRLEKPLGAGGKRIFWELFENQKVQWVENFFRKEGCSISGDAVEAILALVENNTDALRRECSRLILFLGRERPISLTDIETWLPHSREESAFTLFSRIARGDLEKSLGICRSLLSAREAPQAILAGLSWCFHKLRDYERLLKSGGASDFELKKIGLGSSRVREDYIQASRRYSLAAVDRALAVLGSYDIMLRSGGGALEELLMDLFLYKLITGT
ncbi:MAG: DNA polymerase III subunit delta [Spirochaetaceae bacterium]|jgi:DNA polymerase-3 subunit delta|nr:DNA polymerase III subunit delta [Spirochaetaceae bacterium]